MNECMYVCMYVCMYYIGTHGYVCTMYVCTVCTCRVLLLLETADHQLEALASEKLELIFPGH